ncbi:MAG: choice-of-anchor Q domain-containing protein [Kiritimatiellae bacterium]|nr:choice-of-anchor Q domain-containing protein [Kiritimatiellia bacterium]
MSIAAMFERVMNRALLGLGLLWASAACATNVFVVPEGTHAVQPEWVYTNWATAATNIQEAHDAIDINDGNIIFITNGLYRLTNQLMITKGVVLRSWKDGATAPAETILDGNNDGKALSNRVMVVSNAAAVLDGLTIQNGAGADFGAGITIYKCLLVTNCIIQNNISMGIGYGGGGIQVWTPWLGKITHCLVSSNSAGRGGGLLVYNGSTGIIEHCTIISNYASHPNNPNGGGGLNMYGSGTAPFPTTTVTARWCTIAYNTAKACGGGVDMYFNGGVVENCMIVSNYQTTSGIRRGSGVYFYFGTGQGIVRNCLIAGNSNAGNCDAVHMWAGGRMENCTVVNNRNGGIGGLPVPTYSAAGTGVVVNTIIYSNAVYNLIYTNQVEFTNCCAPDELLGADNITGYPAFADPAGDFRLTSDSPCINKGLNLEGMDGARDLPGNRRILERVVDIGAYEFLRRGMVVIGR